MRENLVDVLPELFEDIFKAKGCTHGSKSDISMGMHDGKVGVQWNIDIIKKSGVCRLGVNLEGLKYFDWPISKLLQYELENFELLKLFKLSNDKDIYITIHRDAWQVHARPPIVEQIIGVKEFTNLEITKDKWQKILEEALLCLDIKRGFKGRSIQIVTSLKGIKRKMEVSPHLYVYKIMGIEDKDTKQDIFKTVLHFKNVLEPIYKAVYKIINQE